MTQLLDTTTDSANKETITGNEAAANNEATGSNESTANDEATTSSQTTTKNATSKTHAKVNEYVNLPKCRSDMAPGPPPAALLEPMLQENLGRFVIFPIKHAQLWKMFKKAQASFWTSEEIDLANDMVDYEKLSKDEQHFIKHVLWHFSPRQTA